MKYFTSDWHLGHKEILYADERPFQSLFDMKQVISQNINNCVSEYDTLYVIGDVAYRTHNQQEMIAEFLDSLKVTRKILIMGNHDKMNFEKYIDCGFESVHSSLEITDGNDSYILRHDPSAAGCFRSLNWICGHVHRSYKKCNNVVNVGCCAWDYCPISMIKVKNTIRNGGILINV